MAVPRTPDRDAMPAWQAAGGVTPNTQSYWEQLTNAPERRDAMQRPVKAASYGGGAHAPTLEQLDLSRQSKIRQYYGVDPSLGEEDGQKLLAQKWVYGQPAPEGFHYNEDGLLAKNGNVWKTVGKVAAIAAPVAATIATGGAASPWLIAAIGAGAGAANAALNDQGWRGILAGAALGGVGGYAGAGGFSGAGSAAQAGNSALQTGNAAAETLVKAATPIAGQTAASTGANVAKDIAIKAGVGAAQGAAGGGGVKGALIGAGTGAAGAGVANATSSAPLAGRIAAQAGTKAAIGAAVNGAPGAINGAVQGATQGAKGVGGTMATSNDGIDWASLLAQTAIPVGASIASSLAQGREAGRTQQANQTVTQDQQRATNDSSYERALEQRAQIELQRKQDARAALQQAYGDALRSSLVKNVKDVSFSRPEGVANISFSGGLRPSALGAEGAAAADAMYKKSMLSLLNGEQYSDLPAPEKSNVSKLPEASALDTALGIAGAVGKGLSTAQAAQAQNAQTSLVQELLKNARAQAQTPTTRVNLPAAQAPVSFGTVLPNPTLPSDDDYLYDI